RHALHVLHHEEALVARAANVVSPDHVRVGDPAGEPPPPRDRAQAVVVQREVGPEQLDGDGLVQHAIPCLVDDPHAAGPHTAPQLVAPTNHPADLRFAGGWLRPDSGAVAAHQPAQHVALRSLRAAALLLQQQHLAALAPAIAARVAVATDDPMAG